jgi:glutamate-1-semialdehyde 2,1-aminomutase
MKATILKTDDAKPSLTKSDSNDDLFVIDVARREAITNNAVEFLKIDPQRVRALLDMEDALFESRNPTSKAMFEKAKRSLHNGVPMNWMTRWASPFPLFVKDAKNQYFRDVDGHRYLDFCLGDTGAMVGHAPDVVVEAISAQLKKGMTFMLPTETASWVGTELQHRFGLRYWQVAMTATDANRFCIRLARHITGRKKILTFNWCYHGTVDETFATLNPTTGQVVPRPGNTGYPVHPRETTKVVEFNNIPALEAALRDCDVACVLAEPAMTNIGIILPDPGFHAALRAITRRTGTILIMDETHTICAGPGGYTQKHGLEPDMLTIGKAIAGGYPAAVYGFTESVAAQINAFTERDHADVGGIGGTLSSNAVALVAIKSTLAGALTAETYKRTVPLAKRFTKGVQNVINRYNLPWSVVRLGCRVEYWFRLERAHNGGEAAEAVAGERDLDRFMHLYTLNRGILMTPFHAMALICPTTTEADVDYHTKLFQDAVEALLGLDPLPTSKM